MKNIVINFIIISVLTMGGLQCQTTYTEDNADAVYTHILHEFVLNPDNSTLYNYEHQLLLKSSFSFTRQYGESFVVYNPQQQKLKIKKSETTMKDGTKVKSPSNAFNEVLPRFAADAASYMHFKEMVVTHTGIESGASIDFAYSIESSKEFLPGLLAKVVTGNRCPVRKMTIRVLVPKGTVLQHILINSTIAVQRRTASNFDVYTWEFENLPMIAVEPNQSAFDEFSPVVSFSTFVNDGLFNHITAKANHGNISNQLKEQALKLTENGKSNYEKIEALSAYVQNNISIIDVNLGVLGYQAQSPEITFFKKSGTFLDKALLLQCMGKAVGIEATPVLVSDFKLPATVQSYLPFYNHCLLKVEKESGYVDFMHPQNTAFPAYLFGKTGLNLKPNFAIEEMKLPENATTSAVVKLKINQDASFAGNITFATSGLLLYDLNHKGMETIFKRLFAAGKHKLKIDENGVKSDGAKIASTSMNANIEGKLCIDETGQIFSLMLPGSTGYLDNLHLVINSAIRTTPLSFAFPLKEEFSYEMEVPESWQLFGKLQNTTIKNDVGVVKIDMQQKGNHIVVKRSISLNQNKIEASKVAQLQELLVGWANEDSKKLQFLLK